jgi:hydroxysqualene dehydroxylase
MQVKRMKVLIAGAGWAGLSCAWELCKAGHVVTLLEASRHVGGRARAQTVSFNGQELALDNGQHILIGAYSETLRLMREMGVDISTALLRLPLSMRFPDGSGLQLPDWKKPLLPGLDVALGVLRARGWSSSDKFSLLKTAALWRLQGFVCASDETVASLCSSLTPTVMRTLIEPLCVSALNTPAAQASGVVFLRIMRDSLFAPSVGMNSSNMLLPTVNLGQLFADHAAAQLAQRGVALRLGERLLKVSTARGTALGTAAGTFSNALPSGQHSVQISLRQGEEVTEQYDQVIIATAPTEAARIAQASGYDDWAAVVGRLRFEAIATVYAYSAQAKLPLPIPIPILALDSDAEHPAQFVFDRQALTGERGVLAFVVSAAPQDSSDLEEKIIAQGRKQLNLPDLQAIKTITDKRATFACTPEVQRPSASLDAGLWACGDYVAGPYPSTLEGAVRSGVGVAQSLALGF